MTYVSRKTRIIVSRWSDECDAEYTLRACRKRSDGRLKRHASCDDLRAWINNSCVNHEHMLDLMSDGEFLGKPPFRLYGRFIPVPILFKLMPKVTIDNESENVDENRGRNVRQSKSDTRKDEFSGCRTDSLGRLSSKWKQGKCSDSESQNSRLENKVSVTRLEWEKSLLEKRLCECTCLLNKAVGQLERIDNIVGDEMNSTENAENLRNEQIQSAFLLSRLRCSCPSRNNDSPKPSSSRSYLKKLRESAKCAELMRKISGLREKLKKIQDCRQEISQQIRASKVRVENSDQVTELYSRREHAHIKRLQKKLEKLITERGKLLSEMCQTLTCLNGLKKSSRSSMSFSKRRSRSGRTCQDMQRPPDFCGCACSEYNGSTDSEAVRCSDSSSGESGMNRGYTKCTRTNMDLKNDFELPNGQMSCEKFFNDDSTDSDQFCGYEESVSRNAENQRRKQYCDCNRVSSPEHDPFQKQKTFNDQNQDGCSLDEKSAEKEKDASKVVKKSKVKFICPEPPCRNRTYADDLSAYESSLSPAQEALILGAIKNIQNRRPTTSPITKRERDAIAAEHRPGGLKNCIPERQIRSETTMKEIEKTLRNYEQRLDQLGSLECKVEELKGKSSEAERLRECLERTRAEAKRQRAAEKEKSGREMSKVCSENWELKRQVQQLTARLEGQCKKVQGMKSAVLQARELECEAAELKKELSKYRDSFEHQRMCMSEWESVVAVQRKEIENLMNHIRKLTTMREEAACSAYKMRKAVQRSRSYSPDMKGRGVATARTKPSGRTYRLSSSEEDAACYCSQCLQGEDRHGARQGSPDRGYCSPPGGRGMEWCH